MKPKVLITGASSGLGRYLCLKFESEGHEVLKHEGTKHFDLTKVDEVIALAAKARQFGVKVLVNNAAITCPGKDLEDYNTSKILDMIAVNLTAPVILTHELIDSLTDIININSMVGLEIKEKRTLYSATKWGLRGFSQSLKAENSNLNVLDVYPTNIKTTPDKKYAMDINFVIDNIYNSFTKKDQELILDGRK